jgi:AAHS family 4-hydroxybenzoate transporter-like MFS transporter
MATGGTVHADDVINRTKIGGFQILVLALGAMVLYTDGFNTHDFGTVAFAVREDLGFSYDLQGLIGSASIAGLLVGYVFLSPLSGYFGPKKVVLFSVASYGVMAFISSFAQDAVQLIALRFLTGLTLASAIPAIVAIVGEFAPMRSRSSFITFSYFGLSLGQLSAGGLSILLLADFGWRSLFVAGGLMALAIVPVLFLFLPESVEYLVNRGKQPEKAAKALKRAAPAADIPEGMTVVAGESAKQRVAISELFADGRKLGTLLFWLAIMMNLMPNYFFGNWLTTILVDSGFSDNQALTVKMANDGAGMLVAFIAGPLMDRYGPYRVMACFFLGGAAVVAGTGITLTFGFFLPILTMGFLVGFFTSGVQKGSNAVGVHFYPTALRSAGVGWGLGVGRIGALASPIIAGELLEFGWQSYLLFYLAAAPLLIGMLAQIALHLTYGSRRPGTEREVTPELNTISPAR